jgi:hypothetical protein
VFCIGGGWPRLASMPTKRRSGWRVYAPGISHRLDDATAAIDTRLNQSPPISSKLFTGDNSSLDGLADGILLKNTKRFIADPQLAGIAVNIDVQFPFDTANPYSQS